MADITAAMVKAFRDRTGLPMMECKKALMEAGGDEEAAIEILRKAGKKSMEKRTDRETEAGRIAIYTDPATGTTAMVELLCESAPVSNTDEFIALVNAMAKQLATGPGASSPEELFAQPFPGKSTTIQQEYDDLINKIREVFKLARMIKVEGKSGAYLHHNSGIGVIVPINGENTELARDICMHIASMSPKAISEKDLDPVVVEKERKILMETAAENQAGKPQNIIEKIVEGQVNSFIAENCLLEQMFVKDPSKTVAQIAKEGNIEIREMIHWVLGKN